MKLIMQSPKVQVLKNLILILQLKALMNIIVNLPKMVTSDLEEPKMLISTLNLLN